MTLSELDRRLLDGFQRDLPLCPEPYAEVARRLGTNEARVIESLRRLAREGVVSRVGPVLAPSRFGASTLAALSVPSARIEEVAEIVNAFPQVNHNYEREHAYNLWFVVTAASGNDVRAVIDAIQSRTGLAVMTLPLERAYHIDLGFPLWT